MTSKIAKESVLEGTVHRIIFERENFTIAELVDDQGATRKFKGALSVQPGERVSLRGQWRSQPKYGRQFHARSHRVSLDLSRDGLCHYLAKNPAFEGIGPKKAAKIADAFWENFETVLVNDPAKIKTVAKVSDETVTTIRKTWLKNQKANSLLAHLAAFNLTHHQATHLIKKYGHSIVAILKNDPYAITGKIPGFGFKKVDLIARKMNVARNAACRIEAALIHLMNQETQKGHSFVEREDLVQEVDEFLGSASTESQALIDRCLQSAVEKGNLAIVTLREREVVALPNMVRWETNLTETMREAWKSNPHFHPDDIPHLVHEANQEQQKLLSMQESAVINALKYRISLMSGGAGSGKTFTIQTLHRLYEAQGLKVILCAPTGKAAKRMEQVVGVEAQTIHRLLGYDGRGFKQLELGPVPADVIIVDEFSMVDTGLAHTLFRCVDPTATAVVLVGDHNQIEPVGPGNPLRDLIKTGAIPTTVLNQVVRQAGELKEKCVAILEGEVRPTSKTDEKKPWYNLDTYPSTTMIHEHLVIMHEHLIQERLGLDPVRDVQVLTPTRKGALGTEALNQLIQAVVHKQRYQRKIPKVPAGAKPNFYLGDKVIQIKNDYDLGIMNGAMGYIVGRPEKNKVIVAFEEKTVEIVGPKLFNLELAYALTIHKSQGSEYKCAVVIVHEQHGFMNNRNLLYTAVTRARETVFLMGDGKGAENAAAKQVLQNRRTFLGNWLQDTAHANQGAAHG